MSPSRSSLLVCFVVTLAALSGCRGQTSIEPPIVPFRGMHEMPRYDSQEYSRYFEDDHRTMRPIVEGTLPREADPSLEVSEGTDARGDYVASVPQTVVDRMGGMASMLERGRERYGIYCGPCHGAAGDGHGMVARRAERIGATFVAANLTDPQYLHMADGRLFLTISNGVRTMPAYRSQIPTDDRWAIVSYVRALQLHTADPAVAALDGDRDGIQAWADHCADQAEDVDGFADEDGCPEDDNDGDGIADGIDGCPNTPGPARASLVDGTPPTPASGCPELVRVEASAITLLQPLRFATGSTRLTGRSEAILGEVRAALDANPDLIISVEGHTDDRGNADANRRLSARRAQAVVDWLVDHDIEVWRLTARGFGADRPIADNAAAAGRAQNRRIEFRTSTGAGG